MLLSLCAVLAMPKEVVLTLRAPEAKEVRFAGDLFGWSRPHAMQRKDGVWSLRLDLPDDARFEYKFVVDGEWILDPANPKKVDNGVGGQNSVWEGPKYRFRGLEEAPKRPLRRSTFSAQGREIVIFAPEQSKGRPILLYGDGPNYERFGKIHNVAANLVELGKIRPVVLVLVPPVDRMKEYGEGWRDYAAFLFKSVLPEVRRRTGASQQAKDLFVGGSSMGGLISLRLAQEFPDQVAGGVHAQSGAFVRVSPSLSFAETISSASLKRIAPGARLWFCWGAYEPEIARANEEACATLKRMGRPFAKAHTNEGHNWTAWRNRMSEALTYLLGK
jgi:enterochelin esterase-like enzyme